MNRGILLIVSNAPGIREMMALFGPASVAGIEVVAHRDKNLCDNPKPKQANHHAATVTATVALWRGNRHDTVT